MSESGGFGGMTVAAFESRMAEEMARLIARHGGRPLVAPALREVALERQSEVLGFGERLLAGAVDVVILMTGVGTRTMIDVLETRFPHAAIVQALRRVTLVARGPKPLAALREQGLQAEITVPEPNTWRQILTALDSRASELHGRRIAIQEYGITNPELSAALRTRGADVLSVPIYRWSLPEDLTSLRQAIEAILRGEVDAVLITNAAQVEHVMAVLGQHGADEVYERWRDRLNQMLVGSIGPTASERLRQHGWPIDLEPTHPKMGTLVKEAAHLAGPLLARKRSA